MGPAQAIARGFARSLRFSGRASRSEFWWFAPVAALPPLVAGLNLQWWFPFNPYGIGYVGVLALASLPLMAAAARRLQDMGEPGHHATYPIMPFVFLWMGYQGVLWSSLTTWVGLGLLLAYALFVLLVPLLLFTIFVAIYVTASVLGMLLVPSDPNPNRYGPVPV